MGPKNTSRIAFPWSFFVIAFAYSWLFWLFPVLSAQAQVEPPVPAALLLVLGLFGPSLSGIFLTGKHEGKEALKKLLKRAVDLRIPLRWLAVIFLLPAAVGGSALYLFALVGGKPPEVEFWERPLLMIPLFFGMFVSGPIPEEFGWRGFALDRLQNRYSALGASLVLGVIWSFWHLPMFYSHVTGHEYLSFWQFMLFVCSLAILFTWLYNNTNGNLLAAILFHAAGNFCFFVFALAQMYPGGDNRALSIATGIYAAVAAFVVWMWGPSKLKHEVGGAR